MTEEKELRWHHQLSRHPIEQTLGDSERQGSLQCFSPWGYKESEMTDQLKNNNLWKDLWEGSVFYNACNAFITLKLFQNKSCEHMYLYICLMKHQPWPGAVLRAGHRADQDRQCPHICRRNEAEESEGRTRRRSRHKTKKQNGSAWEV